MVGEHFDHIAGRDVGENRPGRADQVDLVDPQDFGGLEPKGILELPPIVVEHFTDRRVVDSCLFSQMGEGGAERSLFKPCFKPHRHGAFGGDIRKGLIKRLPAGFASETPGINGKTNPFPVEGKVSYPGLPATQAEQSLRAAMIASVGRSRGFSLNVIVPVGVLDLEDSVGGEVQDVRCHSLSGVSPICFLFSMEGSIHYRIASNNPIMASS